MGEKTSNKWHKMKDKREMNHLQLVEVDLIYQIDYTMSLNIEDKTFSIQGKSQNGLLFNPNSLFMVKLSNFLPTFL